jgi:hypothetical protein
MFHRKQLSVCRLTLFHQPLNTWLSLVAVVAAIRMALVTTVQVVVLVAIGHQWLARTLVAVRQPKQQWR